MTCTRCSKAIHPVLDRVWAARVLDVFQCDACGEVETRLKPKVAAAPVSSR